MSSRWQALTPSEKKKYEDLAAQDKHRFLAESHKRDVEAMQRKERLQKERETLILDDQGEGRTRRSRQKEQKKVEKKRAKKLEKKKVKVASKKKVKKEKKRADGDDDSDYQDDSDSSSSSYQDDSSSDSSSSSSSDSEDSYKKKKAPKRPVKVSQAVLQRREQAKQEKLEKEKYIEQRQSDVRSERAEQAKRRLEYLLKQSDIFSHFGNVKQEKARLGLSSSAAATSSQLETKSTAAVSSSKGEKNTIVRKPSGTLGEKVNDHQDEEEREEADEHDATFLTAQPSTLGGGKMRQYQLEGLNWMIRLQENGVNGILADEVSTDLFELLVLQFSLQWQFQQYAVVFL